MEREIIDLTNSEPSTPKKSQRPKRSRPTVPSAESKTTSHQQQQPRSNKLAPRKLAMSDVSSVPQRQQVPRSQNVRGQPRKPTEQTRNRPENSIVRSAIVEKYRYQQPPPISNIKKYCVYYMRGKLPKDQWTQKEHELFLMGLIRYGKGNWSRIAKDFVTSKTPHQVFKYSVNFFRRLPTTCLYTFNFKKSWEKPTTTTTSIARARIFDSNQKAAGTNYKPRPGLPPFSVPRGSSSSSLLPPEITTISVGGAAVPTITVTAEAVHSKPEARAASIANMVMTKPPAATTNKETPQTLILFPVEAPLFPLSAAASSKNNTSVAAANEPEPMDVDFTLALARKKGPDAGDDELNLDLSLGRQQGT